MLVPLQFADRFVRSRRDQLGAHFGPVHVGARERDSVRRVRGVQEPGVTFSDEFPELVLVPFAVLQ